MVESLIDELSSTYFSSHSLEGMLTSFSQEPNDYRNIMSIFATSSILDLDDIVTSIIHITAICQREWDSVRLSTNSAKKKGRYMNWILNVIIVQGSTLKNNF